VRTELEAPLDWPARKEAASIGNLTGGDAESELKRSHRNEYYFNHIIMSLYRAIAHKALDGKVGISAAPNAGRRSAET
jgi:hypothetical protein